MSTITCFLNVLNVILQKRALPKKQEQSDESEEEVKATTSTTLRVIIFYFKFLVFVVVEFFIQMWFKLFYVIEVSTI